jgi:hypothetical protein
LRRLAVRANEYRGIRPGKKGLDRQAPALSSMPLRRAHPRLGRKVTTMNSPATELVEPPEDKPQEEASK